MNNLIPNKITNLVYEFTIETLKEINEEVIHLLMKERYIDRIDATKTMEDNYYFKIISNKIKELHK